MARRRLERRQSLRRQGAWRIRADRPSQGSGDRRLFDNAGGVLVRLELPGWARRPQCERSQNYQQGAVDGDPVDCRLIQERRRRVEHGGKECRGHCGCTAELDVPKLVCQHGLTHVDLRRDEQCICSDHRPNSKDSAGALVACSLPNDQSGVGAIEVEVSRPSTKCRSSSSRCMRQEVPWEARKDEQRDGCERNGRVAKCGIPILHRSNCKSQSASRSSQTHLKTRATCIDYSR